MLLRFKKIWDSEMGELSSKLEGVVGSRIYVLLADKESVQDAKGAFELSLKKFELSL